MKNIIALTFRTLYLQQLGFKRPTDSLSIVLLFTQNSIYC